METSPGADSGVEAAAQGGEAVTTSVAGAGKDVGTVAAGQVKGGFLAPTKSWLCYTGDQVETVSRQKKVSAEEVRSSSVARQERKQSSSAQRAGTAKCLYSVQCASLGLCNFSWERFDCVAWPVPPCSDKLQPVNKAGGDR